MNNNIRLVIEACKELDIYFEIIHPTQNLLRLIIGDKYFYFYNSCTPFITDSSIGKLFKDKEYTYFLLKNTINVPKTKGFLSPFSEARFKKYLLFEDITSILQAIQKDFIMPLIIKRNSGSGGTNVFLCHNEEEIELSLKQIFDMNSKDYDYIALAQEYIDIAHEYRAIIFHNELLLLYEKSKAEAKFVGNLSPLHWEGAKAVHITDQNVIYAIENFIKPIFKEIPVTYGGFDIAQDKNGKYWLIEINSCPKFDIFIRDNNEAIILEILKTMLKKLK
ncbi:alpha-L-glutamate ligase [Nostoc sp. CENA67]|uniref:Alpha-L-glutamate ligase n=1 Tax=Amazonocrinis nigriterrae CENA67 TaxID=2794033 RepID=A0A8J7LD37_9NOST|nr:YheC/YheD family protein [Amazonocrinis nigriterrae]MBH8565386.1 alpha-L-glutamate ligase [Amazonocrinis nigriterrae CENA67]